MNSKEILIIAIILFFILSNKKPKKKGDVETMYTFQMFPEVTGMKRSIGVTSSGQQRVLNEGETEQIGGLKFTFDNMMNGTFRLKIQEGVNVDELIFDKEGTIII